MTFIREKKVAFGKGYLDVDIYEMDDSVMTPLPRAQRVRVSPPHVITAHDRHSRNNLRQLIIHNFWNGDYYITLTYAGDSPDITAAQDELQAFVRRLRRLYKKHGVEFRGIWVTEGGRPKEDGTFTRVHHHLTITGGVPREEIELCWSKPRKTDKVKRGYATVSMIQTREDERGCERIAEYMAKSRTKTMGKWLHRWGSTRNIKRPAEWVNDRHYGKRMTREIAEVKNAVKEERTEKLRRILEKKYGRECIDVIHKVSSFTGWLYVSARFKPKE